MERNPTRSSGNRGPGEGARTWTFDARDADAAGEVRCDIAGGLRTAGATDEDVMAAEMIFSELISNVVFHATGSAEVSLDWYAGAPVLHVLDEGPGFEHIGALPDDILSEHGRGLFLVGALCEEIRVLRRPSVGSHARAILPFATRG